MKKLLLICSVILPLLGRAQGHGYEIGAGVGISLDSRPGDNMYYKGEKMKPNWSAELSGLKNIQKNWQVCVDLQLMRLARGNTQAYQALYLHPPVNPGKTFIYADVAASFCTEVNYKVYLGKQENYVYGGLCVGLAYAKGNTNKESVEVPYCGPNGGYGLSGGAQVGYVYNISSAFLFKAQAAARYMDLGYDAAAPFATPKNAHLHYGIISFPVTVGISYKFDHHSEKIGTRRKPAVKKPAPRPPVKSNTGKSNTKLPSH